MASALAVLIAAVTGAGQLLPEVLADSHLLQIEQALSDGDYSRAWNSLQEVRSLQRDHDLNLPEFHYWHARVSDAMDLPEQALESVTQYLSAEGREARHYVDALALVNTLQEAVLCSGWNTDAYFETATPAQVTACLETGNVDLETPNASGMTALHAAAARANDPVVIEVLLASGTNVAARDGEMRTPLHHAARHSTNPAVVDALLAAGADIMARDNQDRVPLHIAAASDARAAVTSALVDADTDGCTQLGIRTPLPQEKLREGRLSGEDLRGLDLRSWNLSGANLRNADLRGANLANVNLEKVDLRGAKLCGANLQGARLQESKLDDVDLRWAVLRGVEMRGADLDNVDARKADFRNADMRGVDLTDADLRGADLREVDLTHRRDPGFRNTEFTHISSADLGGANLARANLSDLEFGSPNFEGLDLRGVNLENSVLRGNYQDTDMRGANLYNARFTKESDFHGADLRGADLRQVENMDHARNLQAANLEGAILQGSRDANAPSGPSWLDAAIGIAAGTAITAAGGGTEAAAAAGTAFAEGVISGQQPTGSLPSAAAADGSFGNLAGTGGRPCEIPGYPTPANIQNAGVSWCGPGVDFQKRAYALQAAGAWCAIDIGSSSTPEQISARHQEINTACDLLDALHDRLGGRPCQCPSGYRP